MPRQSSEFWLDISEKKTFLSIKIKAESVRKNKRPLFRYVWTPGNP